MKIIKWFLSFFRTQLPQGMTEFNSFVGDVAWLSGLPDNKKLRMVICQLIFSLPPDMARFSKRRLANQLKKAAANQVAHVVLKDFENEEKKQKESEKPTT